MIEFMHDAYNKARMHMHKVGMMRIKCLVHNNGHFVHKDMPRHVYIMRVD
jgi:hypothetical protein